VVDTPSPVIVPAADSLVALRASIAEMGPFRFEDRFDINQGRTHRMYEVLRVPQGGQLGSRPRRKWLAFSDLTALERQRTRRFMYDCDAELLLLTPLGSMYAESFDFASCLYLGEEGVIEAPHLHDALTQQPVPWRMVLDLERDV